MAKKDKPDINFSILLSEANQRNSQFEPHGLPRIQRGVEQIDQLSRKLLAKSARATGDVSKTKAHYLLAGRGFDPDKLTRELNAVSLRVPFEPLETIADTDLNGFLQHQHMMTIETAILEAQKETVQQFSDNYVRAMSSDWEEKKRHLLSAFGQRQGSWGAAQAADPWASTTGATTGALLPAGSGRATLPGLGSSTLSTTAPFTPGKRARTGMNAKQMLYARAVRELNKHKSQDRPYGIATVFRETAQTSTDRDMRKNEVVDCWNLVRHILHEDNVVDGEFQRRPLRPDEYEVDYRRGDNRPLRVKFINGARRFLEEQYRALIGTYVDANLGDTHRGGHPGWLETVRAFLNLKFDRRSKDWPPDLEADVDGYPLWAELYYCLRCGELADAQKVVAEKGANMGDFPKFFAQYCAHGRLDDHMMGQMVRKYRSPEVMRSPDLYKQAVYIIVGRVDQKLLTKVFSTTQDFMWLKLSLIRESDEPLSPELTHTDYRLADLQAMLENFGPRHFNPDGQNPLLYFQILLMSQQFEKAIEYLCQYDQYRVEAVHVAVALAHYGVVRVPESEQGDLVKCEPGPPERCYLNFVKLIRQYCRQFATTDAREALEYYNLLPRTKDVRYKAMRELVMETREFATLLGEVAPDGSVKRGAVFEFMGDAEWRAITRMAAEGSEGVGKYADAVRLFRLADDFNSVLRLVNRWLAQEVTLPSGDEEMGGLVDALACQLDTIRGAAERRQVDHQLFDTFSVLLQLHQFFRLYQERRLGEALEFLDSMNLLPAHEHELDARVANFNTLDDNLRRNFAEILLATMTILHDLYRAAKERAISAGIREDRDLDWLRARSRLLIAFAGMIQYRMPGDTNARLLRMDVLMN